MCKKDWAVYAKTPLGGAAQVLQYLSRYTHCGAIGKERIRSITPREVAFSARPKYKSGEQGKKPEQKRRLRLPGLEFVGLFLQHILPTGLKRIRHYGLLANPNGKKLALAKAALHMPTPTPVAQENAQDFMASVAQIDASQCPVCEHGKLRVVQTCQGQNACPIRCQEGIRVQESRSKAERLRRKGGERDDEDANQRTRQSMGPSAG